MLGAYNQMKSQRENALSGIGEGSVDRVFKHLRPGEPPRYRVALRS